MVLKMSEMIKRRKREKRNPVIAEIKVFSPKYGDLLRGRDPFEILRIYESCEVAGISYITAEAFKGDKRLLKRICEASSLPVLRKDFIESKEEIEETSELGASAVLLIARNLKERTPEMVDFALEHDLETVVEVHSLEDVEIANETKTPMIGINNRDIRRMEMDDGTVEITEKLSKFIRENSLKISESGISTLEDLSRALRCADAVLIGTAFMKSSDIEKTVSSFVNFKF
ncbi:MAG: indole-3-glycerol phosphate synthase [Archaeoglobi archaeon]|nr:indole-3-glycerol phosphate synthase TrpC [Candidatus Mnemosynella bozhongmuii]MDI3502630.1 indole-3-glycerol phosphate synthase [Archaeoglobi archaeon]MDK2780990.1 indole-3-glycerol phosphate synthase [Archaeoglobi archaeon]